MIIRMTFSSCWTYHNATQYNNTIICNSKCW